MVRMRLRCFMRHVEKSASGCWLWTGDTKNGYGTYSERRSAHRMSYEHFCGPIPEGLEVDHLCFVPLCVNPDHLEPVTHAENMRRRYARQTHCKHGHPFDEANTYRWNGHRSCRACGRVRSARYAAKKAAA